MRKSPDLNVHVGITRTLQGIPVREQEIMVSSGPQRRGVSSQFRLLYREGCMPHTSSGNVWWSSVSPTSLLWPASAGPPYEFSSLNSSLTNPFCCQSLLLITPTISFFRYFFFVFWLLSMSDLSLPTTNQTRDPCSGVLYHWTTRKPHSYPLLLINPPLMYPPFSALCHWSSCLDILYHVPWHP